VEERGVHAASTLEYWNGFGNSDAPAFRTLKRAEARAPDGTDNLWMHGTASRRRTKLRLNPG